MSAPGAPAAEPAADALLQAALDAARAAGARFAEARLVERTRERLVFRDGELDTAVHETDRGLGVRALLGDAWGYAGTNLLDAEGVAEAARAAVRAAAATTPAGPLADADLPAAVVGTYQTPQVEDPLAVPLAEKIDLFHRVDAAMRGAVGADPAFKGSRGELTTLRIATRFRASQGTHLAQTITVTGGKMVALAASDDDFQMRSYPKSGEGNAVQAGFEYVRGLDLPGKAADLAREALDLLRAEVAPAGVRTLILDGTQLSLQIHESCGHPSESDRALGEEISLAGASFLLPDDRGALRYGNERVSLTADATTPLGPGTFGFDDEGTPAARAPLVERGLFVGYLSGRETSARLGAPTASALRAESWYGLPIVRMTNINLEPGEGTLDDLVAGTEDGLLLSCNKSWSIDDLRLNFQFTCEIAYEIKGGRRTGRIFKNPVYWGRTPEFWGQCSGVAGPEAWEMWGWLFCGKGDPVQIMHVGHGCAPARFENVRFGAQA